ncbi:MULTISPECIES: hypothetical protein [Burkholderiaceae]|uniref:hypothetical protein n=1 Tax=Burkholderiaceae TaxID=119060 RepID=UPI000963A383|nr:MULTISPECIES: hypothetical protein [Burkholderiaceae]MCG1019729.1 hypothetical protein [Mycetohabitans sp. B4]MCG1040776.1 hypothetical protein [Mycetohabitans sp. B7]SIT65337.1 hypothetical protein SAMN04487769_0675 [Burkholderia sp. b14]SIT79655.1 hypothetical protein SAMN04487768_0299 [Burkholderia sp. b13]
MKIKVMDVCIQFVQLSRLVPSRSATRHDLSLPAIKLTLATYRCAPLPASLLHSFAARGVFLTYR